MKNIKPLLFSTLVGIFLLASCDKDDLNRTSHPDSAKVRLHTEWGTGAAATIPYIVNYSSENSGQVTSEEGKTKIHVIKNLLDPGTYRLELYSKPVDGTGFSVDGDVIEVIEDPEDPGFIYANPAVFFSARQSITVEKDREYDVTVPLYQQMRQLVIRVYLNNDPVIYTWQNPGGSFRELNNITATLEGVANRFNFIDNIYSGSETVKLPFRVRTTTDNKQRYLESVVTLVGFNETATQDFRLEFEFNYGEQVPAVEEEFHSLLFDRDEEIGDFNDYDKKRINDTVLRQIVLPITPGGQAIITDYEERPEGNIEIDEDTFKYKIGDLWPKDSPVKEGVVVWIANTPESSRGLVMSGKQSQAIGWGYLAELSKYSNGVPARETATNLILWETDKTLGDLNTNGIASYINNHVPRTPYEARYTELDFPTYAWIRASESQFTPDWFLPSTTELKFLESVPNLATILANPANGMDPLEDTNGDAPYLWSSQTEPVLKPESTWYDPEMPEYDSSLIYIWHPVTGITTTHAGTLNPAFNPDWEPDLVNFPEITTNPEKPLIFTEYYTRAFRYF